MPEPIIRPDLTSLTLILSVLFSACTDQPTQLFERLSPENSGVDFENRVEERLGNNVLESEFFYNGGGVAVGDINNNGLADLFFTANQGANGLYLNRGDFRFENITEQAGVADPDGWSAGTAMVDINGNGYLDIYVCKAGDLEEDERRNKLFINNGDLSFTERAAEFGLDDPGYCTQPVFFDYNGNGLLDVFIVNYSVRHFIGFDITTIRDEHDPYAGDKLYRNNGDGTFTDVSQEAGITQNPIGFGLSATVSDLTGNGLPDIYVANDFMERDYMYINQGDGTFRDEILSRTDLISYFSMGSDIADINNNGKPDIFVGDMLSPEYERRRVFKTPDYSIYEQLAAHGYHRKNMRNVLQLNNGNGTFSEVGQLAGVSMSDWTWATLLADFTNDGNKDIYITNGFARFYTHMDYLTDVLWAAYPDEDLPDDPDILWDLVQQMERVDIPNVAFRNLGDLQFREVAREWGLRDYSISGGAAYADLNNDGALDLVVNHMNEPAGIYRNRARDLYPQNNYLRVDLRGEGDNTGAIGSTVTIRGNNGQIFFQEAYRTRGFQGSVDPVLVFGVGELSTVDLDVTWPNGSVTHRQEVQVNQTVTLHQVEESDTAPHEEVNPLDRMFLELNRERLGIDWNHAGAFPSDRLIQALLPHTLTNLGPALAVGDVNNDGLPDIYVGGGEDQPGQLWLQQRDGTFRAAEVSAFEEHAHFHDMDALLFDATGNGHPDLYVVSGGNHDQSNGQAYQDRLYINDGFGNFSWHANGLPQMYSSGGTVTAIDLNDNGLLDLFVGGRVFTGQYPNSPRSYILRNEGGSFRDVTGQMSPDLVRPGMVTDALWADVTGDERDELVIAGEWMPIRVFRNNHGESFSEISDELGFSETSGWWHSLEAADFDGNGRLDIVAGNRGLNSHIQASRENPVILYNIDLNENGLYDPLITKVVQGERYPVPGRDMLLQQIPQLREQFPTYESYAEATISDILSSRQLSEADRYYVHTFASTLFINRADGRFEARELPRQAQIAPVFDIFAGDAFNNGHPDLILAGNNYGNRPEAGPTAGQGSLLRGEGDHSFTPVSSAETSFQVLGEVRSMEVVSTGLGPILLLARNNLPLLPLLYQAPETAQE